MKSRKALLNGILAFALLTGAGCQNQHDLDRQAALGRWEHVRLQMGLDQAQGHLNARQFDLAQKSIARVMAIDPQNAPGHVLLGKILLAQDQLGQAKHVFEGCLEIDSNNPQASYFIGVIYEQWNDSEQALRYYQQAQELQDEVPDYTLATAEMLIKRGNIDRALTLLTEYTAKNGPQARLLALKGSILLARGSYNEAVTALQDARRLVGSVTTLDQSLATALCHAGRPAEALELFDGLVKNDEDEQEGRHDVLRGECYMQLGRYHEARRCFERASARDSDNSLVWVRLAQLYLRRSDLDRASQCAERAATLGYAEPELLMVQGILALKNGRTAEASELFRQVIAVDSTDGLAYCLLGQTLTRTDELTEARTCYEQALGIDARDQLASNMRDALPVKQ